MAPQPLALYCQSSEEWLRCVLDNFDEFLIDHAANERKASSMAMSLLAHYPDRAELTLAMVDLALDELNHFRQVFRIMQTRNLVMTPDEKDPYVNQLRSHARKESAAYFMDRLLIAAVIEARGEERFALIANGLADEQLRAFYHTLSKSEKGHHELFIRLARNYFDPDLVATRLDELLAIEQLIIERLPVRSRLH